MDKRSTKRKLKLFLAALALGGLSSFVASPALAGKRVALVIGNAAYKNVPSLRNPVNDARGVKEALEKIGFQTQMVADADYRMFRKSLNEFSVQAADADAVLFYYAGHGAEEQKTGYLLPTDVEADDLRNPAVSQVPSVDLVMAALSSVRGPRIVIVDACREDPNSHDITVGADLQVRDVAVRAINEASETRAANPNAREEGFLIVFSTASKAVAYDGTGSQGPFASSLIRHLGEPGLSAADLFHEVNSDVQAQTNNQQRTSFLDSLRTAYKLNFGSNEDELAWQKLSRNSDSSAADYDAFLSKFPNSAHAYDAQRYRDLLNRFVHDRDLERDAAAETKAWNDAIQANSPDGFASFLGAYPKSGHATEAAQKRDRLVAVAAEAKAWSQAVAGGSADAYDGFVFAFPQSAHKAEAAKLRDDMRAEAKAWAAASADKSADGYDKFASAFPRSAHRDEALRLRNEARAVTAEAAAWANASRDRAADVFEQFALAYPSSAHAAEAQRLAGEARAAAAENSAWAAALRDNSATELDQFATVFPNSPHQRDALARRDALREAAAENAAWASAVKDNTPVEFDLFVSVFPNSAHVREATRRRDDLKTAALAEQERLGWNNAKEVGSVDAYGAFIEEFPHSAHIAEAQRRIGEQKAADEAKTTAEAKSAICRNEGETLAAKIGAKSGPADFAALLSVSSCPTQRPAIEKALAAAKATALAAACVADRAALGAAGSDIVAAQSAIAGMTCEPARQEAKTVVANLQSQADSAKKAAGAQALAQRTCESANRDLDGVDLYDASARYRIAALRQKSGCADPAFAARADEKLADATEGVRSAQKELARLGCYAGSVTGVFDAMTKASLSAYLKADGAAEPVSLRFTPEFLEKLRAHEQGGVCSVVAAKPSPASAPVASLKPSIPEPDKLPAVNTQLRHPPVAHIALRPVEQASRPSTQAPRPASHQIAEHQVVEHHQAAPIARPVAESRPAPRPVPSYGGGGGGASSIMILPN